MDERSERRQRQVAGIVKEYERQQEGRRSEERAVQARSRRLESIRIVLDGIGWVLVVALMINLVFVLRRVKVFSAERFYWAVGNVSHGGQGLEACVGQLWDVRRAVDEYYRLHGSLPADAGVLYDERIFQGVCPVSKKRYETEMIGSVVWARCPDPGQHSVGAVRIELSGGPPVIEEYR